MQAKFQANLDVGNASLDICLITFKCWIAFYIQMVLEIAQQQVQIIHVVDARKDICKMQLKISRNAIAIFLEL